AETPKTTTPNEAIDRRASDGGFRDCGGGDLRRAIASLSPGASSASKRGEIPQLDPAVDPKALGPSEPLGARPGPELPMGFDRQPGRGHAARHEGPLDGPGASPRKPEVVRHAPELVGVPVDPEREPAARGSPVGK